MSSEDGTYINHACPLCNELTRSRIQSEAKIQDIDLTKFPDDLTVYIVFLKCAGIDCESPVILLAPVKKRSDRCRVDDPHLRELDQPRRRLLKGLCPKLSVRRSRVEAVRVGA
jgi:hypothetical protein